MCHEVDGVPLESPFVRDVIDRSDSRVTVDLEIILVKFGRIEIVVIPVFASQNRL